MNTILVSSNGFTRLESKIVDFSFRCLKKINPQNRYRHISVLTYKGNIIEYGLNDEQSSYQNRLGYLSIHSEYNAIKRFLKTHTLNELDSISLYNCRINRYNQLVNSKPCRRCQYMLSIFSPKKVFHSNENGEFEQWLG